MKILVIATHPDDEVLGVGGTIRKHIKQDDCVEILIITKPIQPEWSLDYCKEKKKQQKEVDICLGISKRHFLEIDCLTLNTLSRGRFNQFIYDKIREIGPDIIYTHYNKELNNEHTLVSLGTLVGTRTPSHCTVYMYETPSVRYSLKAFSPNYYVRLTPELLNVKLNAFSLYKSEVKEAPHHRSLAGVRNLAEYRGFEVGWRYAEAFKQIKRFWS